MTRLIAAVAGCCFGLPLLVLLTLAGAPDAGALPGAPDAAALTDAGATAVPGATGSEASQLRAVPAALRPAFLAAARRYALPPALLAAVGKVESGFDPAAVGPPVPGGPAEGMMQFLPGSWQLFNVVPGATPFDPGPAVLAAANHLRHSGALPGGGWDVSQALFGYNHSTVYVAQVLAVAADYGYRPTEGSRS